VHRRSLPLLCLAVLAGCGGGQAVTIPDGFTVRTVEKPAFSLALPQHWRSFGDTSHTSAKSITGGNQRLRLELETLARSDSPIKLIGVDPTGGLRSATNMNVLQTRVPSSISFDEMTRIEATQIRRASGIKRIEQEQTEVPAGRALHLTYHPRATALVQQYFVRHGDFLYVLTYSSPSAAGEQYAAVFDQSAHTFALG
jgi:hypothetical protein